MTHTNDTELKLHIGVFSARGTPTGSDNSFSSSLYHVVEERAAFVPVIDILRNPHELLNTFGL